MLLLKCREFKRKYLENVKNYIECFKMLNGFNLEGKLRIEYC